MNTNIQKTIVLGVLVALTGVQCWGAAGAQCRGAANDNQLLWHAAQNGDVVEVRRLLNAGVDVNATDPIGQTALIRAAGRGQNEVIKELLAAGADVNIATRIAAEREFPGVTALITAARFGNAQTVEMLVDAGADVNMGDQYGNTPLILAAKEWGNLKKLLILLENGADPDQPNLDGLTAEDWALYDGDQLMYMALATWKKLGG